MSNARKLKLHIVTVNFNIQIFSFRKINAFSYLNFENVYVLYVHVIIIFLLFLMRTEKKFVGNDFDDF